MFCSFRGQNGVGRRLGLWLPWLAGWPTPARDRESDGMQKLKNENNENNEKWIALTGAQRPTRAGPEPPKTMKKRKMKFKTIQNEWGTWGPK